MKIEHNWVPEYFQDRLTYVGGVNRYDEPNFRLAWAQTETHIAGGVWTVDEARFSGYRHVLTGSGEPCWSLLQWHAPEEYGSPESYYVTNYDEASGFQVNGEYPYSGRYEILYNMRYYERVGDKLEFRTMSLNNYVFDRVVPVILLARGVSAERRKAAALAAREEEERAKLGDVERHLRDHAIPFSGGVSFTRQGVRSTAVDQKALELQRSWNLLASSAREFRSGMQTR